MITENEGLIVYESLRHNPDVKLWVSTYMSIPRLYKLDGAILLKSALIRAMLTDDVSRIELPEGMPRELHDKVVKALRSVDIETLLLHNRLGV